MSNQVSETLLKMINSMSDIESNISKIDGAIFVRENEKIIKEKISYLYNLLHAEATFYNQKQDVFFEETEQIISKYKQKLNLVYDEFYCQYVNIQNEIQDTRLNQKISMINYQKVINDKENYKNIDNLKNELKNKNEVYLKIIEKCNNKFEECKLNFEKKVNEAFLIEDTLIVANNNFFVKLKNKILNFFKGSKKYKEVLNSYSSKVDLINYQKIIDELREETVDFVTEILEMRDVDDLEFAI